MRNSWHTACPITPQEVTRVLRAVEQSRPVTAARKMSKLAWKVLAAHLQSKDFRTSLTTALSILHMYERELGQGKERRRMAARRRARLTDGVLTNLAKQIKEREDVGSSEHEDPAAGCE